MRRACPICATTTRTLLDEAPGVDTLWDHLDEIPSTSLATPNLLFYQDDSEDADAWPLIGFGWSTGYAPCAPPAIGCLTDADWHVHEAGYHHAPLGDGGMTLATDGDLIAAAASSSVDDAGCEPVWCTDLEVPLDRDGPLRRGGLLRPRLHRLRRRVRPAVGAGVWRARSGRPPAQV